MDFNGCKDFLMETAKTLLAADSPSGFTQNAVAAAERIAGCLLYTSVDGVWIAVPFAELACWALSIGFLAAKRNKYHYV